MGRENITRLDIESSTFDEMRQSFNRALQGTLANMEARHSDEATITLKLAICINHLSAPDPESIEGNCRIIQKPTIEHKITSVISLKSEIKGALEDDYELIYDGMTKSYALKAVGGEQATVWDET